MNEPLNMQQRFAPAIDRLAGDYQLLKKMARVTVEDLPAAIAAAEDAIERQSGLEAEKHLHRLKGMLSTFETNGVVIEIQKMMVLAATSDHSGLRQQFQREQGRIEQLVREIKALAAD